MKPKLAMSAQEAKKGLVKAKATLAKKKVPNEAALKKGLFVNAKNPDRPGKTASVSVLSYMKTAEDVHPVMKAQAKMVEKEHNSAMSAIKSLKRSPK